MKVNSSIFNSYTGIIKDIQLVQTNIDVMLSLNLRVTIV